MSDGFTQVTKKNPCRICGKDSWCGIANDETVAICMKAESMRPTRNGGWVHKLASVHHSNQRSVTRIQHPKKKDNPEDRRTSDWGNRQAEFVGCYSRKPHLATSLSAVLGVTTKTIERFGVGWYDDWGVYTMPMWSPDCVIAGFQTRAPDGNKRAITGSKMGLFLDPAMSKPDKILFIGEGFSDTATLLDWDLPAIGRPGCMASLPQAVEFCKGMDVCIIADVGVPGQRGAWKLADAMMFKAKLIRVLTPPKEYDDLRGWRTSGCDVDEFMECVRTRNPIWGRSNYR